MPVPPLSTAQINAITALAGQNLPEDQLRARIGQITAGPNGQSSLNAGDLNSVLTGIRAGNAGDLRTVLAGIETGIGTTKAHPGVSWVDIVITTVVTVCGFACGGGPHDTPLNPYNGNGCCLPALPIPRPSPGGIIPTPLPIGR